MDYAKRLLMESVIPDVPVNYELMSPDLTSFIDFWLDEIDDRLNAMTLE